MKSSLLLAMLLTGSIHLYSQEAPRVFKNTTLYPEGRLEIGTYGFATKYLGEFTDNRVGEGIGFTTKYTLPSLPEISFGARYTHGYLRYDRRYASRFGISYDQQFPEEHFTGAKKNGTIRRTKIDSYEALAYLNLFPRHELNYYLMGGVGVLAFQPQDVIDNPYTESGRGVIMSKSLNKTNLIFTTSEVWELIIILLLLSPLEPRPLYIYCQQIMSMAMQAR
ncbi:MAG TPA: hypothetical protein VEC36_10025 [Patescibacteria group bacterium]|nr:hypothetical protein [Patescibacteria group bacterium]